MSSDAVTVIVLEVVSTENAPKSYTIFLTVHSKFEVTLIVVELPELGPK